MPDPMLAIPPAFPTPESVYLVALAEREAEDYPDGLTGTMVAHCLRCTSFWLARDRLASRDTGPWRYLALGEAALHFLGALAGPDRVHDSPFHFGRLRAFGGRLALAPEGLAKGVEAPFATAVGEPAAVAARLETVALKGRPPEAGAW